jgi:mono/diheme cytochrome c family protein
MPRTLAFLLLLPSVALAAPDGPKLYKEQCARCHGDAGQGVKKKYDDQLAGDLSVPQLAEQVRKTMPDDKPESLTKEEATAIAAFMHTAFYSPAAREKTNPVRADAARLTVNQYRQAAADLVGSFRGGTNQWKDGGKGLKGEYFANRNYGNRQKERFDPTVAFDFKTDPPTDGKYDEHEYSVRWSGSVLAPESGEFTFVVKSDQAVQLWVNGERVVNALVKSGNQTEYTAGVTLTGGRVYPIRLDFSKALQGVKDKKPKPVPAFVRLEWRRPHGAAEPIPTRYLSPNGVPEQFVVSTPFPPDDKSMGWERGTRVSKEWDAAVTEAALELAAYVVKAHEPLAGINPKDPADKKAPKLKEFAARFVERAFRRPLTPDLKAVFVEKQFTAANGDAEMFLKRVVLLAAKSPRFLMREASDKPDAFDVAAKLSFALWDSSPDDALLKDAANGWLKTPEQVRKHAERMMADPRAEAKVRGFLLHWLRLDQDRDLAKNEKLFPGFDAATVADLRTSLELFLDEVVWAKESDFRQLLKADDVYLNGRLAKVYGVSLPADAPFQKVKLDPGRRAGVLTHPYLLTTFAYTDHSSPIHRGVFIGKGLLGVGLKPPQEAFSPLAASAHPTLSTRERVALQTKGANCQTCHNVINPLGFTLEGFDAIGKVRAKDNNKPVDTAGRYLTKAGEEKTFAGPTDLAAFIADSPEAHAAFAAQLFHHLIQQPVRAFGPNRAEELRDSFAKSGYSIHALAADIAASAALK